jgi:hypothetical protein
MWGFWLHEVKRFQNDWSSINFHNSGPQKAQLVDPEFKIQVTWGVQNIQTRVRTPCITCWINLGARKLPNLLQNRSCIKIFNWPNSYYIWINLLDRKFTKFIAKYEPVINLIAITCWINLLDRKFTKFIAKYEPVSRFLIDSIAITCWINLIV